MVTKKVRGNTSQKGDGNIGDKLLVCTKGMAPQIKVNKKDKYWTLLGLAALSDNPSMCVVIFAEIREQAIF